TGISARNSEVIHAGIYYAAGSLMARTCLEGRQMLYRHCESHGVPHRRCGKLIVATTTAEVAILAAIAARAAANGVGDLRQLSKSEALALEPELFCEGALLSPLTGIIDAHALMLSLLGEAEENGAVLALRAPVESVAPAGSGFIVTTAGEAPMEIACNHFINAAGLGAIPLAHCIAGLDPAHIPSAYFAKGNYFTLAGGSPVSRLIYPVPVPGGLGTHLTLDLAGQAKFGPDVEWVEKPDYAVDPARAASFAAAVRRYWPSLKDETLQPGYAGVRPKIVPPGASPQDFVIDGPGRHGIPGLVNLFGIESPGLTSALALAKMAAAALG
ncbi:MAG: NAD(P)/FAD-dependent oxidoreductase, partial [Rhizobiales bacterium]|nr:NAD(P)/FAD-dependent oxidoreductase [Hyphomicrobiales bacterium]